MSALAQRDLVLGSMPGIVALVVLSGCGRIGFDPIGEGATDAGVDAAHVDAGPVDANQLDAERGDAAGDAASDAGEEPGWPNMPAGCTVVTDTSFDSLTADGWASSGTVGLAVDPTAPMSPDSVVDFVYPEGFGGGGAPGSVFYLFLEPTASTLREVYVGLMWKPSDPWDSHAIGANGIFLVHRDDAGAAVFHGLIMQGADGGPYSLHCDVEGDVLAPNVDDVAVTLGEWHRLELLHRMSTTGTSADGLVEWWMDGVSIGRYTNVSFTQAPHDAVVLRPIWGGAGDMKTQEDHYWVDHAVVCVNE